MLEQEKSNSRICVGTYSTWILCSGNIKDRRTSRYGAYKKYTRAQYVFNKLFANCSQFKTKENFYYNVHWATYDLPRYNYDIIKKLLEHSSTPFCSLGFCFFSLLDEYIPEKIEDWTLISELVNILIQIASYPFVRHYITKKFRKVVGGKVTHENIKEFKKIINKHEKNRYKRYIINTGLHDILKHFNGTINNLVSDSRQYGGQQHIIVSTDKFEYPLMEITKTNIMLKIDYIGDFYIDTNERRLVLTSSARINEISSNLKNIANVLLNSGKVPKDRLNLSRLVANLI